ncbi:hypothetical protein [Gilvibacter sediminis]|uniref:hypothetical protein n=1 Tax=Gilvibacter sediminis TaxID=379071 RepID=UPI00235003D3|nr:hypothetical protein [Gilvibacter sediminis]MDC7998938.1 hypothetical protein [Gilvibacter sediminis]
MKKKLLLFFALACSMSFAQTQQDHTIYGTVSLNLGNYVGFDAELDYIYKEKYSFRLGYSGNIREPKSAPDDYSTGLAGVLLLGLTSPFDQFENVYAGAGRVWNLNPAGTIRINATVGLGFTILREPGNWQPVSNGFLSENYTWEYNRYNTVSVVISPKIEFPITRVFGLVVAPTLQINKDRTFIGIGIGNMIGLLRKRDTPASDQEQ